MFHPAIGRVLFALVIGAVALSCAAADGFAPPDESLYAMGRHVYERNCRVCHGRWGDGDGEMAKGMIPKPRQFSAGIFKYRSTPSGCLPTTDDLIRTIRQGRANTSMPFFSQLSDREVRAVAEFIKFFSPAGASPRTTAFRSGCLSHPHGWRGQPKQLPAPTRAG